MREEQLVEQINTILKLLDQLDQQMNGGEREAPSTGSKSTIQQLQKLESGLIVPSSQVTQRLRADQASRDAERLSVATADLQRKLATFPLDFYAVDSEMPAMPDRSAMPGVRYRDLERLLNQLGWPVNWEPCCNTDDDPLGASDPYMHAIRMNSTKVGPEFSDTLRLRVLAHEAGHVLRGHVVIGDETEYIARDYITHKAERECEAELFSFLLCAGWEIDVSDNAACYVAHWATFDSREMVSRIFPDVTRSVRAVLDHFEGGDNARKPEAAEAASEVPAWSRAASDL